VEALSLRHLAGEAAEHVSSLDVKLLRTLVVLLRRPGELTRAYVRGARTLYARPVQLFLLINVAFFFAASPLGVFRYELPATVPQSVPTRTVHGRILLAKMKERGTTWDDMRTRYNESVDRRKRELISLWVLAFGLGLALLQIRRRRYLAEHLVFSVHFFTFVLLYTPIVIGVMRLTLQRAESNVVNVVVGSTLTLALFGGVVVYLAVALHRVYVVRPWLALVQGALLVCGLLAFARVYATTVQIVAAWMT
jgi:hypothetical protein